MDYYIGMLGLFGFNFAPVNFSHCNGALLQVSQSTALYSLIGIAYGGNGTTTFALPNLNSRAPIGYYTGGSTQGLTQRTLGQSLGQETQTLSMLQMPQHSHSATFTPSGGSAVEVKASATGGNAPTPSAGAYLAGTVDSGGTQFASYTTSPGSLVALGGVSGGGGGGNVAVGNAGGSQAFGLMNPVLAINFSICVDGIYPPRP